MGEEIETIIKDDKDQTQIKRLYDKNLFIRVVTAVIDFAFAAVFGTLLFLLLSSFVFMPIAKGVHAYDEVAMKEISDAIEKEEGKSHLFAVNPNYDSSAQVSKYVTFVDESVKDQFSTYEAFQNEIVQYYTVYLNNLPDNGGGRFITQEDLDYNLDHHRYSVYWYNVFILGQDDVNNYYTSEELDAREEFVKVDGKELFAYDEDKYDEIAVAKDEYKNTEEGQKKLLEYFYKKTPIKDLVSKEYKYHDKDGKEQTAKVKFYPCVYEKSVAHWMYESSTSIDNELSIFQLSLRWDAIVEVVGRWQTTYPVLAAIVIAWFIMYFAIPLIAKNGRTLGKMMFKQAVVNKLGYSITPAQLFLRSIVPLVIVVISYVVGMLINMTIFFFMLMMVTLSSFALMIFTKKHQAIHDLLGGTQVIDSEKSVWFKNKNEESIYQENLEKMTKQEEEIPQGKK